MSEPPVAAGVPRRSLLLAAGGSVVAAALPACAPADALAHISGGFVGAADVRGHRLRPGRDGVAVPSAGAASGAGWPERRTRVLVIGAGVAGLAVARALRLRGRDADLTLLELEDQPGGNSRAGAVQGLACPLGAHYLPLPGDSAAGVQDLLTELGLGQRLHGRWGLTAAGERHLCHSPQERLYLNGQWQDGLLPLHGASAATLRQYQAFAAAVVQAERQAPFAVPYPFLQQKSPFRHIHQALDAINFEAWLNQSGFNDPWLRWYLDYCCRDDYGAGIAQVSAWAGLHYFASRHGFVAPRSDAPANPDEDGEAHVRAGLGGGVLTWPEGNGWLTQRLAAPLGGRLRTGRVVQRVSVQRHAVLVDAWNAADGQWERWRADHCVLAVPLLVAARLLDAPPAALPAAVRALRYAPWLVANLHLSAPLSDQGGAAPSWDNVLFGQPPDAAPGAGLGYVDATHQRLSPLPGPTLLTHYRSFGIDLKTRRWLADQPWAYWRQAIVHELSVAHPDLAAKCTRIDCMRYGHAMAVPTPGLLEHPAMVALRAEPARHARLHFAHSDLSGYSVFEEAFAWGERVGAHIAARL